MAPCCYAGRACAPDASGCARARISTLSVYGALYIVFVAACQAHNGERLRLPTKLTKVVIGYNAIMAVLVLAAVVVNFVVEGAWFLLAVYASVLASHHHALIGGDLEGALLILRAFVCDRLAQLVGSLSAYSASRIADLTRATDRLRPSRRRPCADAARAGG